MRGLVGGGKKDNVGPNKLTGNTVVMRSILGPCLVFDTLHEATVSISCEFTELKKLALENQTCY